jgi:GNAT superfamily N-acetyltransferase
MPAATSAPRLREAVRADIPALWEVRYAVRENTLTPGRLSDEDVRREIDDPAKGWVIEEDGRIQGFAIANARSGNIWALFLRPEAEGRGLGMLLHDAMLAWLRTQPIARLWLTTGAGTRACGFYARMGWERIGPEPGDEIRYERDNG